MSDDDASALIRELGLQPHPEGGWFRETFRDPVTDAAGRAASTAIYYLLEAGQVSAWHRVDAVETWHFYAGSPLRLTLANPTGGVVETLTLGPDVLADQRPQVVIDRRWWQSARSLGAWTLVGCTVAPGFEFSGFEMAPEGWSPPPAPTAPRRARLGLWRPPLSD
jgi:predicted cupin superfamily sugar epimerase